MARSALSSVRLSLPYTVIPDEDRVHLIAGEDARLTLHGPNLGSWLPALLERLETQTVAQALAGVPPRHRDRASSLLDRLLGERVLVDAVTCTQPLAANHLVVQGEGSIRTWLENNAAPDAVGPPAVFVHCQDRLDYDAVLQFQRARRERGEPWIWASYGAMARGFVSPVFLPEIGPCFRCLLSAFQRLSPVPEIYDHLSRHTREGGQVRPVSFPAPGIAILGELVRWKASLCAEVPEPDAIYRLHVLEAASLEVTSHRVLVDPECPVCGYAVRGGS